MRTLRSASAAGLGTAAATANDATGDDEHAVDPGTDPGHALRRARDLLPHFEIALEEAAAAMEEARNAHRRNDDVSAHVKQLEADRADLGRRLAEAEEQMGRLMTLYVATYQLHATLDPAEVQSTIVDIVLNLLGAEEFVLLLRDEKSPDYEIA